MMSLHTLRSRPRAAGLTTALGALALLGGCAEEPPTGPTPIDLRSNDVVLSWNTIAHDALVAHDKYADPMAAVRVLAIVHIAQHDAVNAIDPVFHTYAFDGRDAAADPVAAAASAAHHVLASTFPAQRQALDEKLALALGSLPDGEAETHGVSLGRQAAQAILDRRRGDGSESPGVYIPGTGPGRYQFTPPFDFAAAPGWRNLRPFALTSPSQFRSAPPPALTSAEYTAAFAEVRAVGRKGSAVRTPDQTAYAKFWYEFSDIGWNRIGRTVAAERRLGLQSTARLFALLNMAMSDSYVAGWDSKYHYDFWRPRTAVREAATDGNPATVADPEWEPAEITPPVQDYPSTHSALGNAAAAVLADVFGDETRFSFASPTAEPAGSVRSFSSFSQAADENADSRVMGGLHFRFACEAGQELGRRVGRWTVTHHLGRR